MHLVGYFYTIYITMHGSMNIKNILFFQLSIGYCTTIHSTLYCCWRHKFTINYRCATTADSNMFLNDTECIVAFPLQQWSLENAKMSRYTYFVYFVFIFTATVKVISSKHSILERQKPEGKLWKPYPESVQ